MSHRRTRASLFAAVVVAAGVVAPVVLAVPGAVAAPGTVPAGPTVTNAVPNFTPSQSVMRSSLGGVNTDSEKATVDRLIGSAAAFLTVSALWRLVVSMM